MTTSVTAIIRFDSATPLTASPDKMKSLIIFTGILFTVVIGINGDCNVCQSSTNTACVSNTEYQFCQNNVPNGTIFPCDNGEYCSILGGCTIDSALTECNDCGKCDADNKFACIGTNLVSVCTEGINATQITAQCNAGFVCNINFKEICVDSVPTCSFREDPTPTTPSPETNPAGYCEALAMEGRFPIGTNASSTCHQYVHCLNINDTWYGPVYNCPGNTYFDGSKGVCVAELPAFCSSRIARLSFRNILLE